MQTSRRASVVFRPAPAALCATLVLLLGCAGDGVPPNTEGEFAQIQVNIFNPSCLAAGCHNAQFRAGDLNLSAGASYDQLVGQTSDNPTARAQGLLRVEPFSPETSFLVIKLRAPGPGEGSLMPRDAGPLSEAQIRQIEDWIRNGALRDEAPSPTPTPTPAD
jgi:hypothetical protein